MTTRTHRIQVNLLALQLVLGVYHEPLPSQADTASPDELVACLDELVLSNQQVHVNSMRAHLVSCACTPQSL